MNQAALVLALFVMPLQGQETVVPYNLNEEKLPTYNAQTKHRVTIQFDRPVKFGRGDQMKLLEQLRAAKGVRFPESLTNGDINAVEGFSLVAVGKKPESVLKRVFSIICPALRIKLKPLSATQNAKLK